MTSSNRTPKGNFTNLSSNPAEQQAELAFAARVEDTLNEAGVPVPNQIHILGQALADLQSKQG